MYRVLILAAVLPFVGNADLGRAASQQFDVEIVAIDLAGRQTNLTQNAAVDLAPAVSRDGRIVFLSTRDGGPELYVMDGDGRNVRVLTTSRDVVWNDALDASQASWSPRGEKIAFDGLSGAGTPGCLQHCANWDVLVVDSDGSGLEQVALGRAPAWSPDGRRLAFESGVDAYGDAGSVTITRLDGSGSVQVNAFNHSSDVGPVWSPTRDELAFQAGPADASSSSIYVIGADGRRKRRLALGHNPIWSPDGRRLAFIDDYKLFTIDRDGKGKQRLSRKGEFVVGAAWSPSGRLGFVAGTTAGRFGGAPRNLRVETASTDGKRVHVLAREPAGSLVWGPPVWTADGKRILVAVEAH